MNARFAPARGVPALLVLLGAGLAHAQNSATPPQAASPPAASPQSAAPPTASPPPGVSDSNNAPVSTPVSAIAPAGPAESGDAAGKLVLLFGSGSDGLGTTNEAKLDEAGRLYRSGKPIIMVVTGSSDTTGSPAGNLILSQRRADAVAQGLEARGIPAERTQILAKGVTNLPVKTGPGVDEPQNRRVEITWR